MNVPPWPADDLVVRARDTNGLIYFGEESPASRLAIAFFISSRLFEFGFSVPRFGTTLIRENRDKRGIGVQRVLLNR